MVQDGKEAVAEGKCKTSRYVVELGFSSGPGVPQDGAGQIE